MSGFGLNAYKRVAVEAAVDPGNPHQLVLMLYDGALESLRGCSALIARRDIAGKGAAIGRAVRILEEGLKAAVDRSAGGLLPRQLVELYDYMIMRLLQANLRNDTQALAEVIALLEDLRGAWAQIRGSTPTAAPVAPARPAGPVTASPAPVRRLADPFAAAPARGFAASA
jgi:flagellar protein FliS